MEKFIFKFQNMATTLELNPAEGVTSTRWHTDDGFWEEANKSQEANMKTIVSFMSRWSGKQPRELAEQMLKEQLNFGAYSAEGLANLIAKVSEPIEVSEADFSSASVALCEFAEKWIKELKDQLIEQGLESSCLYTQQLDAVLWGLDLSSKMFKSKAA